MAVCLRRTCRGRLDPLAITTWSSSMPPPTTARRSMGSDNLRAAQLAPPDYMYLRHSHSHIPKSPPSDRFGDSMTALCEADLPIWQ
jgi:hypothetical protein